jgi:hypothetical protein
MLCILSKSKIHHIRQGDVLWKRACQRGLWDQDLMSFVNMCNSDVYNAYTLLLI